MPKIHMSHATASQPAIKTTVCSNHYLSPACQAAKSPTFHFPNIQPAMPSSLLFTTIPLSPSSSSSSCHCFSAKMHVFRAKSTNRKCHVSTSMACACLPHIMPCIGQGVLERAFVPPASLPPSHGPASPFSQRSPKAWVAEGAVCQQCRRVAGGALLKPCEVRDGEE